MDFLTIVLVLDATARLGTPLILAALAGLFAERSGVVDIGLEGKMLAAAFAAGAVAAISASAWLGLLAGIGCSIALALVHGFASITHNGNQVVSGMAINIIASGLTIVLGHSWFERGGSTPMLTGAARFDDIELPLAETIGAVPVLGPLYAELLSGHNILVYAAFLAVPAAWWVVYRTRFGLRLRAVGENPHAVDTAGISVARMRYLALIVCGALCGIAGAYLSTAHSAQFGREMTAGKGFLALAALILGKWRPTPTLLACLLFALAEVAAAWLQGVPVPGLGIIPVQIIQALPYVVVVLVLAGFIGKAVAPRASGIPYTKER